MQVKIAAVFDATQAKAQFAALTAQAEALNAAIAKTAMAPEGGSAQGYRKIAAAMNEADRAFNSTLASSGQFRLEQIKINDAVNRNTELLQKQKLGFNEVFGRQGRANMRAVYREQLAMQTMFARANQNLIGDGKTRMTLAIPSEVHSSWDTLNNRIGMFRHELSSVSEQMINWGKNTQWAGRQLMVGFTMPVAAFGAAAGVMSYQTDKLLAQITKVYDFSAAAQEDGALREKEAMRLREESMQNAINVAKDYGNAVTETLAVEQELAATGLVGRNLLDSTREVQRISTLGDIDPMQTTAMVVSLQTAFKDTIRDGEDLTNVLNFMNSTAAATSLDLQDIAEATPRAASGLAQLGVSAEEMTVLLVSMREAGVDATSAANGLKSASTRIINPVKKAVDIYAQYGINLEKISEQSGGNLFEFLKALGEAQNANIIGKNDKNTAYLKAQGVAALFGTYQNNRLTASLTNLSDALSGNADDANQTRKAMELMGLSTEELAKRAENSMNDIAESASGKFKRAFETLRGELAPIGDMFLKVGTTFLKAVTDLASWFNSLPESVKSFATASAIIMALVGPLVMIIGLFANFMGNIGKFGSFLLGFVSKFELLNKSQWATKISAELAAKAYNTQENSARMLEMRLESLTAASRASAQALSSMAGIPMPMVSSQIATPTDLRKQHGPAAPNHAQWTSMYLAENRTANGRYRDADTGLFTSKATAEAKAQLKASERMAIQHSSIVTSADAAGRIQEKTKNSITASGVGMGVMSASMATMMLTSNETANNIAKWAMIGTLIVPAVATLGKGMAFAAKAGWAFAASQAAAAKTAAWNAAAVATTAGKGAAAMGLLRGSAAGVLGLMGPIGWAATGLTLALGGAYMIHKKNEESIARQLEQQKSLNKATEDWVSILGVKEVERKEITPMGVTAKERDKTEAQVQQLKSSETGKVLLSAYGDADSDYEKETIAAQQYINILKNTDATAAQARQALEVMFLAAGEGAMAAERKAQELSQAIGAVGSQDMQILWTRQIQDALDESVTQSSEIGKQIGVVLAQEIAEAPYPEMRDTKLDDMMKSLESGWQAVIGRMTSTSQDIFSDIGVDGSNIRSMIAQWHRVVKGEITQQDFSDLFNLGSQDAGDVQVLFRELDGLIAGAGGEADALRATEKGIVKYLKEQRGIEGDLITLNQLRASFGWELYNVTKATANELFRQRAAQLLVMGSLFGSTDDAKNSMIDLLKAQIQTQLEANGYTNELKKGKNEAEGIRKNLEALPNSIGIDINAKQRTEMLRSAQTAVVEEIATSVQSAAEAGWDAQMSALENRQESAADALDRRQQAATDAFDKRWERRRKAVENFYDKRIEGIEKEIEAEQKAEDIRQKIFEAEQSRLSRLAEAANATIDFNLAFETGDLDEAAKLRNDMEAQAREWELEDAGGKGASRSERIRSRLEDKADRLSERKDKALEALDKQEEAERRSLERRQEMQKEHLDKVQEMQKDSLQARIDADKNALDQQLTTFKSFVPKNMKELKAWMDEMGITYDKFGLDFLKPTAEDWGRWYKNSFNRNLRDAGLEAASSNMWEVLGNDVAKQTLAGMGFANMKELERFVKTGDLPKGFVKTANNATRVDADDNRRPPSNPERPNAVSTLHSGGFVDGGKGSGRKGVARTAGLHSSEQMVRARIGEYVVNEKAAAQYGDILESMNKGIYGGGGSMAGILAAIAARSMSAGVASVFHDNVKTRKRAQRGARKAAAVTGLLTGSVYTPGSGARSRPLPAGYGYGSIHGAETGFPAVDLPAPVGTPAYAVANGVITTSTDLTGYEPRNAVQNGYRSYGRYMVLKTDAGPSALYAHLSARGVAAGTRVKGGAVIGRTGNTGRSTGPHLHFGATNGPLAWLKNGGTTKGDGLAMLHDQETVLTKPLSKDLKDTVEAFGYISRDMGWENALAGIPSGGYSISQDNVAAGGNNTYNVNVNVAQTNASADEIVKKTMKAIKREESRKPGKR